MRLLIVTGKDALIVKIGSTTTIEKAVRNFLKSKNVDFTGDFVYYDRKNKFNVAPVRKNAAAIRKFIRSIEKKWGTIDYVLLIGGDDIVPFFRLKNPCNDDDSMIYSDNPYASTDNDHEIPERACARIPDNADGEYIIRQLNKVPTLTKNAFGISARVWEKASEDVYQIIGQGKDLKRSPPITNTSFKKTWLKHKDFLYFNLHGSKISAHWYGQDGSKYPVALSIDRLDRPQGIVAAECCYGAFIIGKTHENSIALNFLNNDGIYGFCGSTTIAYGPAVPPSSEADLLVKYFFEYLKQGLTMGESFKNAKLDFARRVLRTQGFLDEDDRKTLLQFVLYGDPTIRMIDHRV
ncbi:hypothetical protein JXB22_04785 [candidate division WOR-3 bacterium]|nr:hypothetical protein [candidate division WOR-3 bacterium]